MPSSQLLSRGTTYAGINSNIMEDLTCCISILVQYIHIMHYNVATTKYFSMSIQYALWLHTHAFHSHTKKLLSKPRSFASSVKSKKDSVSLCWNRVWHEQSESGRVEASMAALNYLCSRQKMMSNLTTNRYLNMSPSAWEHIHHALEMRPSQDITTLLSIRVHIAANRWKSQH